MKTFLASLIPGKKIALALMLAIPVATVFEIIKLYVYDDFKFLTSLGMLVVIDSALGMWNAWSKHSFSSRGFSQIISKTALYVAALLTVSIIAKSAANEELKPIIQWMSGVLNISLLTREGISIFENIALINPDLIPKSILKRLQAFDTETAEPLEKKEDKL